MIEKISFSVATILDGSCPVEYNGENPKPIITFRENSEDLVYPDGNSWMHEYVFGTIGEIYGE